MAQVCPLSSAQLLASASDWMSWQSSSMSCLRTHAAVNYLDEAQPVGWLLAFQLIETGAVLALAAILFIIAWRRVRSSTTIRAACGRRHCRGSW